MRKFYYEGISHFIISKKHTQPTRSSISRCIDGGKRSLILSNSFASANEAILCGVKPCSAENKIKTQFVKCTQKFE
jgi:hypothetical protein